MTICRELLGFSIPVVLTCSLYWGSPLRAHDHVHHDSADVQAPWTTDTGVDLTKPAVSPEGPACEVNLRLVDPFGQRPVHGLIRVSLDGQVCALKTLMSRAEGVTAKDVGERVFAHLNSWSILPGESTLELPRAVVQVEFLRGPESRRGIVQLDLRNRDRLTEDLVVRPLNPDQSPNWYAGNTHVHLQQMSMRRAEEYACQTAAADGYDLVFFSYLERAEADKQYTSNHFTAADLARFSQRSGVLFGYGEEYRHNLVGHPEGYGHVMFLELSKLVLPASLGRSLTRSGNDDVPLRPGIEAARSQDATILWCHGTRGMEDIPSWLAGLLDVQMIFDQGSLGTYQDALYRYWDLGLKVPIATGTDWFFRDMATVFAHLKVPLTRADWLAALRDGHSFITNGPILDFTVADQPVGNRVSVSAGESVPFHAQIDSAYDFGALEVVLADQTISTPAVKSDGGYTAEISGQYRPTASHWIAARVIPFTANYDKPEWEASGHFNAFGKPIFAHTSPSFVIVDQQPVFAAQAARSLLRELQRSRATLLAKGDYTSQRTRDSVLKIYDEAISELRQRLSP